VEGSKIIIETLSHSGVEIEGVYALNEWVEKNEELLLPHKDKVFRITEKELQRISLLQTPNQVLMVIKKPVQEHAEAELKNTLSLYIDDIRDPGNLGTIWRIADWFGVGNIFVSRDSVEIWNPKVIQSSMGAFLRVNCIEMDIDELLDANPGIEVMGAVMDGTDIMKNKFPGKGILVIGNESKGISKHIAQKLTIRLTIPRDRRGGAESLNAAVATGILCAMLKNT
jgi:TrmH family RNA methyltransferase